MFTIKWRIPLAQAIFDYMKIDPYKSSEFYSLLYDDLTPVPPKVVEPTNVVPQNNAKTKRVQNKRPRIDASLNVDGNSQDVLKQKVIEMVNKTQDSPIIRADFKDTKVSNELTCDATMQSSTWDDGIKLINHMKTNKCTSIAFTLKP